jgi:hypothetical protein
MIIESFKEVSHKENKPHFCLVNQVHYAVYEGKSGMLWIFEVSGDVVSPASLVGFLSV